MAGHTYHVQKGDTLIRIAHDNGFGDWKTIWEHASNAGLRGKRDPQRLFPGDSVFIPEKGERWVRVSTNQKHVFELRTPKTLLRVVLTDRFGDPIRQERFEVDVDGKTYEGRTNGDGLVECDISPAARDAVVRLPEREIEWHVEIGTLAPIDELEGVQGALQDLGYLAGDVTGKADDPTRKALGEFQTRHQLKVTYEVNDETRKALEAALIVS